jgi:hypothetical protein
MTAPRDTKVISVRFPASLLGRVDRLAATAGLTRSGAVLLSCAAGVDPVGRAVDAHPSNTPQETSK